MPPEINSLGTTVFRVLLNISLLVLIRIYFFVPDIINWLKKHSVKKKTATDNIITAEESLHPLPELK